MATITGTAGHDSLRGTAGGDIVLLLAGDDRTYALSGNDRLYGGDGNDTLDGGDPRHHGYHEAHLHGDAGDDLILGGGAGVDSFFFRASTTDGYGRPFAIATDSRVHDFAAGEDISLDRAQVPSGDHASDYGDNVPRDVTLDEISLARSGNDLVLIGPEFSDAGENICTRP